MTAPALFIAPMSRKGRARRVLFVAIVVCALVVPAAGSATPTPWSASRGVLIEGATVVTMDARHDVVPFGSVLVRDGKIVAVWSGPKPPKGVVVGNATVVKAGPLDLLFPGLINLHDHPSFDVLPVWLPPSSDAQLAVGKAGTDPYANRYQWGADGSPTAPSVWACRPRWTSMPRRERCSGARPRCRTAPASSSTEWSRTG
jgi:hypothetical protein